ESSTTPAPRSNRTTAASPSRPPSTISTPLSWRIHCGYVAKSAMTAITAAGSAAISMLERADSGMAASRWQRSLAFRSDELRSHAFRSEQRAHDEECDEDDDAHQARSPDHDPELGLLAWGAESAADAVGA